MTAYHANLAAGIVHTTDSAACRLAQPEPSRWPAYLTAAFLALCGFWVIVWPAVSMVWR